jgi:hypothetical protein
LYVNKNIYEPQRKYNSFILLNILEDEEWFKEYITVKYKAVDVNISGVWKMKVPRSYHIT